MTNLTSSLIFECIGGIEDFFLHEAEVTDAAALKARKRKKIVQYSAAGAGLAVAVGIAVAYWRRGVGKTAKAA